MEQVLISKPETCCHFTLYSLTRRLSDPDSDSADKRGSNWAALSLTVRKTVGLTP